MSDAKEAVFIESDTTVAGLKLRPLTAGTLILLRKTGNPLLDGKAVGNMEYQVAAFLFIHAADPAAVRRAARDPVTFEDAVLAFADSVSIKDFVTVADQIKGLVERATVGMDYTTTEEGGADPNS